MPYIGNIIAHHGVLPSDHLTDHDLVPDELKLLCEADMSIDSAGKNVGFVRRLAGIDKKYGVNSHSYKVCKEQIEWLKENIKQ